MSLLEFTDHRMHAIKAAFDEGGFPGVVSLIGGTHISIRTLVWRSQKHTLIEKNPFNKCASYL